MLYLGEALALTRSGGYKHQEAGIIASMGSVVRQQGKLAESLGFLFQSIKIAEADKSMSDLARGYRRITDVYMDLEDFPKAILYLSAALKIDSANHFESGEMNDRMTLGFAYEKLNKLDSAELHTNLVLQQKNKIQKLVQYVLAVSANIALKKGEVARADSLFRQALALSEANSDYLTAADICGDMAKLFTANRQKDSAIAYALRGFEFSQRINFRKGMMRTGTMLAELYGKESPGNAIDYYKIAARAKDSLFGMGSIQMIQNMVAGEEARQKEAEETRIAYRNQVKMYSLLAGLAVLLIIAVLLYRNNKQKQKANSLLSAQKEKVESALAQLNETQAQLIQSEKMASLGQLTAGIAHEIQNPLNFVNNFSEVSVDLTREMLEEVGKGNTMEAKEIASDLIQNLQKINHHGKRADEIVKGMLQHSRAGTGSKEQTDINALCDEYLRLAYHGMRGKDNEFTATLKTDYDPAIGRLNISPQDIGRVLLNLYNNAFYTVAEKKKQAGENYTPVVAVTTKKQTGKIEIHVHDNGKGVPHLIIDKIFQPFFTTKPTGQGTGLGLSLSYVIIKAHGGEIKIESQENRGSTFIIQLPVQLPS